jgi:hypothetical protein
MRSQNSFKTPIFKATFFKKIFVKRGVLSILMTLSFFSHFDSQQGLAVASEECSTIDFRNDFPLRMRHQQQTSWCFAHSAADLIQFSFQLNEQISAADIAIQYSETRISKTMQTLKKLLQKNSGKIPAETGFIKIALDLAMKNGVCPESAFPSEQWNKIDDHGNISKVEITKAIIDTLNLQKTIHHSNLSSASQIPWHFEFKHLSREQFYQILKNSDKKNVFSSIRSMACNPERIQLPPLFKAKFKIKNKKTFQFIHDSFEHHQPVTIDFFSDLLRHADHPKKSMSELHTVLLYGRKTNPITNECEFMIKDSYGEQCTKYDPQLTCENGYVWLPQQKLKKAMTSTLLMWNTQ